MAKNNPHGLTDKQLAFCNEYLKDFNGTQAAIRAGYSEKTADVAACKDLLGNPKIQDYLSKRQQSVAKKVDLSVERVLAEYAKIAFFDPRKLLNDDGSLVPIGELDDDTAGAIGGVELYEEKSAAGEETFTAGVTKKVKISDKRAALDSICKVLGYNAPDKSQVDMGITWNEERTYSNPDAA